MGNQVHAWAQHLLGKNSLEECTVQELQQLADRYPYYAPARFLLVQKLKAEGSPNYAAQLQKAVLYYHDPLLLEAVLSPEKFYTETEAFTAPQEPETILTEAPAVQSVEVLPAQEEEAHSLEPEVSEGPINEPEQEFTEPEALQEPGTPLTEPEPQPEPEITEEPVPPAQDEKQPSPFKFQLSNEQPSAGLSFEPYHTVDYFASQGIKLSQEETGKDAFGKQLKSFTEWLKTMKRLPVSEMVAKLDNGSESHVKNLANDSVSDNNIVTETMAEVWIKQGNPQKALEVYNKLILLNPSKKAYFAAKIENLKRS